MVDTVKMDPLSTSASIVAVLQLSSEVIKYINAAKGATKERRSLREALRACEAVLQELRDEADDSKEGKSWSSTIAALEAPGAPLGRLWMGLTQLERRLAPSDGTNRLLTTLLWPFQEREVRELLTLVEREKSLLQLALANNSRKLLQEIKRTADENSAQLESLTNLLEATSLETSHQLRSITRGLTDLHNSQDGRDESRTRQAMLEWLSPVDHAAQQSDFLSRRQPGTGQWLLDSPELHEWISSDASTLFCPGIPGAGKTILASVLNNELISRFRGDERIGVAYFYCNFRQQDIQTPNNILASLVKQLASQLYPLPRCIKALFDDYANRPARPTEDEIAGSFQATCSLFSEVYIVVDALDECEARHRDRLLSRLRHMQWFWTLKLFVTSRSIPDVVGHFKDDTALEIKASQDDVRSFLEQNLSLPATFVRRYPNLHEDVVEATIKAVDGMQVIIC